MRHLWCGRDEWPMAWAVRHHQRSRVCARDKLQTCAMNIRQPAVAGTFYEGTPERLRAQVDNCFAENSKADAKTRFIGAVVPHAGLMYSGHVAAAVYRRADLPKRLISLCPNHTGAGHFAAINGEAAWPTPFGDP